MKTKVEIIDKKYYINNVKNTVTCVLECGVKAHNIPEWWGVHSSPSFTVRGIAKCSPLDTFDEELGMKIAESRAKKAMFTKMCKMLNKVLTIIMEDAKSVTSTIIGNQLAISREKEHLKELLNS
jgi:hypothetical protein